MLRSRRLFVAFYAMSGAAALVYEVTWTRLLTLQMRHTVSAVSTVLAALVFSRTALASRPGLAGAHAQLGASFNLTGRFADARRELEEAIRLDSRDLASHVGLAVADANLGQLAEARAHIDAALRLDPGSAQARRVRLALDQAAEGRPRPESKR